MNKLAFFVLSLMISLLSVVLFAIATFELLDDEQFVNSLHLPPEADSLSIPLAGGWLASVILLIIMIFLHIVILIFCLTKLKAKKIYLNGFLLKKKEPILNLLRIISYITILAILYQYVDLQKDMEKFFEFNLLLSISISSTITIFTIWFIGIFGPKRNAETNSCGKKGLNLV